MRLLLAGLALGVVFTLSSGAEAYERQWHVGGGLGYALYMPGEGLPVTAPMHGAAASLHLTYGLSDAFNLMAQIDGSYHPGPMPVVIGGGSVGVGYVFDVLRLVPYVGVMVGGNGVFIGGECGQAGETTCNGFRLGLSGQGGIDYQITRSFAVGAAARYGLLLLGPGLDQSVTAFLRAEYIWGY